MRGFHIRQGTKKVFDHCYHSATRDIVFIGRPHRHHPRSPQVAHLPPQLGQVPHVRLLFLVIPIRTQRALATQAAARARTVRPRIFQTYRDAVLGGGRVESKDKTESVFAIEIETVETFLTDEAKRGVEGKGSGVVVFGLKDDLDVVGKKDNCCSEGGDGRKAHEGHTSSTPLDFMASMEWRTRALATHVRPQRRLEARACAGHGTPTRQQRDNNTSNAGPIESDIRSG